MSYSAQSIKVLHVDDEPDFVEMAAEFIQREGEGFSVQTETSVDGALNQLPGEFDCIVSDYDMPGRDGIEFLRQVREDYPDLPFILFTGKGSEEIASLAISAGVSDYLQKGSGTERYSLLANRIENLVSQHRATMEVATRVRQQRLIADLGQKALVVRDLQELFEEAVEAASDGLGTEFAKVLELRPDGEDLLLRAGVGWRNGLVGEALVGTGDDSQAGHTLRSEEPIVVTNLQTEDRFRGPALLVEHDVTSGISTIIGSADDPWGVLGTHSTRERSFSEDDITFMRNLSNVLTNAIAREADRSQLSSTREWYQRVLEHLSDHVIIVDESAKVTYCSPSVKQVLGFTPEEVVGKDAFEFVHPDDRDIVAGAFGEVLGDPSSEVLVEYRLRGKDGRFRWIEAHGGSYLDDPVIEGVMVSVREITDRKEHEQELQRYETILETIDDVVFVVDEEWIVEYTSPAILGYLDVPIEELQGQPVMDLADTFVVDEDGPDRFEAALEGAFGKDETEPPERVELTLDFDGRHVVFEYQFSPIIRDEKPNVVAITMREITHRKERESQLRQTTAKLQAIYENSPDMINVLDSEGLLVDVNQRFCDELGYEKNDVLGRPICEFDRAFDERNLKELLSGLKIGERRKFEGVNERQDGTTLPVEVHLLRLDIAGADRFLAISRDISERKVREQALETLHDVAAELVLAESESEIAEQVVQAANDVLDFPLAMVRYFDEDVNGLVPIAASEETDEIFEERPVFTPSSGSLNWEVYETGERRLFTDVTEEPAAFDAETDLRSLMLLPIGNHGTLSAGSTEPDAFDEGDVLLAELLTDTARAVLDRLQKEEEVRTERNQFRSLFDLIPEPVTHVRFEDGEPIIKAVNSAFEETFDCIADQVIGKSTNDVIVPSGHGEDAERLDSRARTGDLVEAEVRRKTGEGIGDFLFRGVPAHGSDAKEEEYFGIYIDVTEHKTTERQLERQNQRLDQFTSVVSHDLKNPLSVIMGRLELAREEYESDDLDAIARAADRMHEMIDDLLTLAREGDRVGEMEPVELQSIAEECWQTVEREGASLNIETDRSVLADRSQLRQILENLFGNAVEHGGSDVTITVGTSTDPDGFYVEDDGPGIPEPERKRVFGAGYTTDDDGTGFGLSIVREIAEGHGWGINLNESESGGARFEFARVEFTE